MSVEMINNKGPFCPATTDLSPEMYAEVVESRWLADLRESQDALAKAEADHKKSRNALDRMYEMHSDLIDVYAELCTSHDQLERDYSDLEKYYAKMSVEFADTIWDLERADARGDRFKVYLIIMAGVIFCLLSYILLTAI